MAYKGKTKEKIKKLKERGFLKGITIPRMWTTNENGDLYELTEDQIVKKMYPFLDDANNLDVKKGEKEI